MSGLLDSTPLFNIVISLAMFVIGVALWAVGKAHILTRTFGQVVMVLWLTQWCFLAGIYMLFIKYPAERGWILFLSDVQSLLVLGTGWVLFEGEQFSWKGLAGFGAVLFVCLLFWNAYYFPGNAVTASRIQGLAWLAPSVTLASLAMPLIGLAFFIRYHVWGIPILVLSVIYGGFQQAAYSASLLTGSSVSQAFPGAAVIFLALACGKFILGAVFYGMLVLELDQYSTAVPALTPNNELRIRDGLGRAIGWILTSILVPVLTAAASKWIEKHMQ